MEITFFTDIQTNISNFCLLNIKNYYDKRKEKKFFNRIDHGVYDLKKSDEYKNIDLLHSLLNDKLLLVNETISIDYPCDMNLKYSELFIQKTNENIKKYYNNSHYIITPQYHFMDKISFIEQFNQNKQYFNDRIVGFGNLCRIMYKNSYTDFIFDYIYNNLPVNQKIHFYGIGMNLIRNYIPKLTKKFNISIDSTKWTKAITNELKIGNGVCCRKNNRDLYFLAYMNEIKKTGINVIF